MPDVTKSDIAAVIVLYRPGAEVLDNVAVVAAQCDHVFAVDNTEEPDIDFVRAMCAAEDLTYAPLGQNLGIAAALNAGVELAQESGYTWALTMDQDSTPDAHMVEALRVCASSCSEPVGILAPRHSEPGVPVETRDAGCRRVLTTMTSGDLLSLEAWRLVGGFDEGLFIDSVDHDFCLKLDRSGLRVMECGAALLVHRVGATAKARFPVTAHPSHHEALRRYYITRNRFIVGDRYRAAHPEFRAAEMRALKRELVKVVLFEGHKWQKLRMSWRGYRDYRCGVTGPYRAKVPAPGSTSAKGGRS